MFTGILFLCVFVFIIVFFVLYIKTWNQGRAKRQAGAEANRQRHGGRCVLE